MWTTSSAREQQSIGSRMIGFVSCWRYQRPVTGGGIVKEQPDKVWPFESVCVFEGRGGEGLSVSMSEWLCVCVCVCVYVCVCVCECVCVCVCV